MENNAFKSSLFGGFNREDVIDYITKASSESAARIEALEEDVNKLCTQERELRAQNSSLREENDTLHDKLLASSEELASLRASLDAAVDELTALRAEAAALRAENDGLKTENDRLRPLAEQYSTVKDHIAGIELDAHQRAEEYERGSRERLAAMVRDCRTRCDAVLSTLGETCANVSNELRRAEVSVSTLPSVFDALRGSLEELEVSE